MYENPPLYTWFDEDDETDGLWDRIAMPIVRGPFLFDVSVVREGKNLQYHARVYTKAPETRSHPSPYGDLIHKGPYIPNDRALTRWATAFLRHNLLAQRTKSPLRGHLISFHPETQA